MNKIRNILHNSTFWFFVRMLLCSLPLFISFDKQQLENTLSSFSSFITVGVLAMYSVTISYLPLVYKDYLTLIKKIGTISNIEDSIKQFETVKNEISSTVIKSIIVYGLSFVLPLVFHRLNLSSFFAKRDFNIYLVKIYTTIILALILWLFHVLIDIIIVYKETLNQQFMIVSYNIQNENENENKD